MRLEVHGEVLVVLTCHNISGCMLVIPLLQTKLRSIITLAQIITVLCIDIHLNDHP